MKKILFNPLFEDFSVQYDINGNLKPETFTVPATRVASFEPEIYDHVRKHLIDKILNERNLNPTIPGNIENIIKEIEVEDE